MSKGTNLLKTGRLEMRKFTFYRFFRPNSFEKGAMQQSHFTNVLSDILDLETNHIHNQLKHKTFIQNLFFYILN